MKSLIKNNLYLVICLFCMFVINISCSSDSKDESPVNSAKNITAADFEVTVEDYTEDDLRNEINQDDSFFDNEQDDDDCLDSKLNLVKAQPASDDFYEISIPDTDFTACETDVTSAVFSMYFLVQALDDSDNPIDLSGITLNELDALVFSEAKILVKSYFKVNDNNFEYIGKGMECSTSEPSEPYSYLPNIKDGCTEYSLASGIRGEEEFIDFKIHDFNNISESDEGLYYGSGTIDFTMHNWIGTMTYTAADIAPTYTATNGTDTISGIFDYNSDKAVKSFSFTGIAKRAINNVKYGISKAIK